jgi:IclR family pca regulon transcriptional regulator
MIKTRTSKRKSSEAVKQPRAKKGKVRPPEGMAGLAKGLGIIETLGSNRSTLSVSDAARATGITRPAARRCLLTLTEFGYLVHDGKLFRPTPRLLRIGSAYLEAAPLPQLAQPFLVSAREELNESVTLAIFEDGWSVFVARAEVDRVVTTGVRLGGRLPAYSSATGRVLLAALDDERLRRYLAESQFVRTTPHTLVDAGQILQRVLDARAQGYTYTDEEIELGMRSFAVAVKNAQGRTVAALSVSAFSARVSLDRMRRDYLPVLESKARALGQLL